MRTYKPEYLGKVIPANDASKLTDFVTNKYDAFSKIYETCKGLSEKITDIIAVDSSNSESLSVKISTDSGTLDSISNEAKKNESVTVVGDIITAGTK